MERRVESPTESRPEAAPEEEARQIFLRTLYPLNPGIQHGVDFPGGWGNGVRSE